MFQMRGSMQSVSLNCRGQLATKHKSCLHLSGEGPRASQHVSVFAILLPEFEPRTFRIYTYTINPLTPNDYYSRRTAPLTSKRGILYIYSTNIGTDYFKHGVYSPFFFLFKMQFLFHNSNGFGSYIIHILYTECAKIKIIIPVPKG